MNDYRCIVADPPWIQRGSRGAVNHYPVLHASEIAYTIATAPVWRPAPDCHLWLWVTNAELQNGLRVMSELGFRYVTNLAWVKANIGLGFYLRHQHELCLLGVRGDTMQPDDLSVSSVVRPALGQRRLRHSEKPCEAFAAIERVSPGPRLEMFARAPREGWDVWGNECPARIPTCGECSLSLDNNRGAVKVKPRGSVLLDGEVCAGGESGPTCPAFKPAELSQKEDQR